MRGLLPTLIIPVLGMGLLCGLPATGGTSPSAWAAESAIPGDGEVLEPVKVIETSIVRVPREVPMPLPDLDAAVGYPLEELSVAAHGAVVARAAFTGIRRLRDDTAARMGVRTPVGYLAADRPLYPRIAREMGWQGTVVVRVEVQENGAPGTVAVGKSCGHEVLDDAAVAAVKGWRFTPLTDGGFTFRTTVQVPVIFDLRRF